jgi:hypothetical protein
MAVDREALLDQLALVFARAAVDELLDEQDGESGDEERSEQTEARAP